MINSLELGKKVIKDKIPMIPKNPGIKKVKTKIGTIIIRPIVSIFGIFSFIIYS